MKKVISLLICLVMAAALLCGFAVTAGAETYGLYTYTVTDGCATIDKISDTASGSVVIPSTLGGYPVTKIGGMVMYGNDDVTSLTIPEGVTEIGWCAFSSCSNLEYVYFPSTITYCDSDVFSGCYKLKELHIPDMDAWCRIEFDDFTGNPVWYADDFYVNNELVTKVVVPAGTEELSKYLFMNSNDIQTVVLPASLKEVGYGAFDCDKLTTVWYVGASKNDINIGSNNSQLESATWHYLDGYCATACSDCGAAYEDAISHRYTNACDAYCDGCNLERIPEHVYADACDTVCDECGMERKVPHIYSAVCDEECDLCGFLRATEHTPDAEGKCSVCDKEASDLSGWVELEGNFYYYENGSKKFSCWVGDGSGSRYVDEKGILVINGWVLDNGVEVRVGADGYRLTMRWFHDGINWLYLDQNGARMRDCWKKDSKGWCYLGEDGYMVTDAWMKDSKGWVYVGANGYMLTNAWVKDSVGWCYVGSDGYCVTSCWKKDSKGWCYLDANGRLVTNKWVKDSKGWCYVDGSGYMAYNRWVQDSKGWCYVGNSGYMVYNKWVKTGGLWYYINGKGYMVTGWLSQGGKWYYLESDGAMATGYKIINSKAYYFYDSGVMLANADLGSGYVGSNGHVSNSCFAYLAARDFRRIRSDYSSATAQGAYVQAFVDRNGDFCVIVKVYYKIISNYNVTYLHNLTKGTFIKDPATYYDKLQDQYYGNSKIHYMQMEQDVLEMEISAVKNGAYVSASYLGM